MTVLTKGRSFVTVSSCSNIYGGVLLGPETPTLVIYRGKVALVAGVVEK